ncbi:MAG TPA: 30S ribosomal protein S1 [Clostridiales bacterium]|nr:30S ribosomal protein S1 [Clostridiales bacterium]
MRKFYPEGWLIDSPANKKALSSPTALADAAAKGDILEARAVLCDTDHNLIVDLGCMRGIIPRVEGAIGIASGKVRDIAILSRVNKPVCFVVTGIKTDPDDRPYALLSRRIAQERCQQEYISNLRPGDIINARITHLENFGVFCDIGCGIVALLPIDAISVSRISHPSDRFRTGTDIRVVVKDFDDEGRITLTHKELLGTWEQNAALFSQGETVSGIIRSVEDYGVFVELTPNLAGLAEPYPGARPNQQACVYIKSIIPEKMKIKLIIIDAFDADYSPGPIKYFYKEDYIESWYYSPENCNKTIETHFMQKLVSSRKGGL